MKERKQEDKRKKERTWGINANRSCEYDNQPADDIIITGLIQFELWLWMHILDKDLKWIGMNVIRAAVDVSVVFTRALSDQQSNEICLLLIRNSWLQNCITTNLTSAQLTCTFAAWRCSTAVLLLHDTDNTAIRSLHETDCSTFIANRWQYCCTFTAWRRQHCVFVLLLEQANTQLAAASRRLS